MERPYGARIPENFRWMAGKTMEEIQAIKEESRLTGKECNEVVRTDEWKKRLPSSSKKKR